MKLGMKMLAYLANHQSGVRNVVAVCCVSLIAIGCGGSGANPKVVAKPRASAAGKVTIDGKPVPAGIISFINKDSGNSASGTITDGAFSVKAADGPNPGPNAIAIIGKEKAGEDDKWRWSSNIDVPAAGYTGDFTIKQKETKPVAKTVIDN